MIRYFESISTDLDKSGALDGASTFKILWNILIPQAKTGIIAISVLSFILSWNDISFSFFFSDNIEFKTFADGLEQFRISDPTYTNMPSFAASSFIVVTIAILLFGLLEYSIDKKFNKI